MELCQQTSVTSDPKRRQAVQRRNWKSNEEEEEKKRSSENVLGKRLQHAGPQALLYSLREMYWPVAGRNLARQVVHSCVTCRRTASGVIRKSFAKICPLLDASSLEDGASKAGVKETSKNVAGVVVQEDEEVDVMVPRPLKSIYLFL
ncbi:unnamed protein product, partial [Iphiclides podalirius]